MKKLFKVLRVGRLHKQPLLSPIHIECKPRSYRLRVLYPCETECSGRYFTNNQGRKLQVLTNHTIAPRCTIVFYNLFESIAKTILGGVVCSLCDSRIQSIYHQSTEMYVTVSQGLYGYLYFTSDMLVSAGNSGAWTVLLAMQIHLRGNHSI